MNSNRRTFIRKSLLLTGAAAISRTAADQEQCLTPLEGDRLVLLGTQGGPFIRSYKQTPSASLLVYNNIPIVIDTGYGVTFKLLEAGISLPQLKYIFITHHHSDHNLELGALLYNAWIAGLATPVHVYAPVGLTDMLTAWWKCNEFDITTRIKDEGRPDIRQLVTPHEIADGVLLSTPDMEVSALKNIHPPVDNSFAFKYKLGKKTIVFSGDTAYCPALAGFATGADYLIHEAMYTPAVDDIIKRRPNATKLIASIKSHHTSAEDAGRIAKEANVKNLILQHFVPPDDKSLTDQTWINAARTTFPGNIIVGKDLQQFAL